jgi:hypothetical protein
MKALPIITIVFGAWLVGGCGNSQEKLQPPESELVRLQEQLTAAQGQISNLQQQVMAASNQIADLRPWADKARTLPLRVAPVRSNSSTNGNYQFLNLLSSAVAVRIQLSNSVGGQTMTLTRVLPGVRPAPPFEVGLADGWPVAPGDVIQISSDGYEVLTKKF